MNVDKDIRSDDRDGVHPNLREWEDKGNPAKEIEIGGEPGTNGDLGAT